MSWEEFSLLAQGYAKKRDREIQDVKFIAWHSMIGTRIDKIPSFDQFMGVKTTPKASVQQRENYIREAEEYFKRKKNGK